MTDEWDGYLSWSRFGKNAELKGEMAKEVGLNMKAAYDRMKKAM